MDEVNEAVSKALAMSYVFLPEEAADLDREEVARFIAELGEQGYVIVPANPPEALS